MSVHTAGDFGTNFKFELNRFFYDEFCIRTCIFIRIINIQGLLSVQRAFIINEYMINYYILRALQFLLLYIKSLFFTFLRNNII